MSKDMTHVIYVHCFSIKNVGRIVDSDRLHITDIIKIYFDQMMKCKIILLVLWIKIDIAGKSTIFAFFKLSNM